MFDWIKKKIKLAKIGAIIFAIIFVLLIASTIFLLVKNAKLERELKDAIKNIDFLQNENVR